MSPIINAVTLQLLALAGVAGFLLIKQRRASQLPRRVTVVPVSDDALLPGQQAAMAGLDPQLAALGYQPVGNGHYGHTGPTQLLRLYGHPDDPAVVLAFLFEPRAPLKPISSVEFMTARADGSEVATGNTTVSAIFATHPGDRIQRCPGLAPAALKQRHDAACKETDPPPIRLDGFEAIMRFGADYHARAMDHQVAMGLMRFDPATDTYRGTFRLAYRQLREAISLLLGLRG